MGRINFFYEKQAYRQKHMNLPNERKKWLKSLIENTGYTLVMLNYIFVSDEEILRINRESLNHDYYTDIITFNLADYPNEIEAEIYISIDRVTENAQKLQVPYFDELTRVMSHGLLHLIGYDDKTQEQRKQMRIKEDEAIALFNENYLIQT